MLRSRNKHLDYKNSPKEMTCPFCDLKKGDERVIQSGKNTTLIRNIYPYEWWDRCKVVDHLLIVPNKHTDRFYELSKEAKSEYLDYIAEYEKKGYSLYARAPGSKRKTRFHQHMHLIKTDNKPRGFAFFMHKPFLTLYK